MVGTAREVKEWLSRTGYPLEMEVAKNLQVAGFGISPSEYFEDSDTGKWRETDVVAYEQYKSNNCQFNFALIAECKGKKEEPWVLFSTKDGYPETLSVVRRATSEKGRLILTALAPNQDVRESPLFAVPEHQGYNLVVKKEDKKNKDVAYSALESVLKATMGLVNRLDGLPHINAIPFVWPVIVINAPLFESYLDGKGELQVNEIKKGLLIWKNPMIANNTFVDIYIQKTNF